MAAIRLYFSVNTGLPAASPTLLIFYKSGGLQALTGKTARGSRLNRVFSCI